MLSRKSPQSPRVVALIPARSGSKRLAQKNIRTLSGHPLIAYTICAAIQSAIFDEVMVSTDNQLYAKVALHYGASVPFLRPEALAGDKSPDIEWVKHALNSYKNDGVEFDYFSILRPTSPFRTEHTIQRAFAQIQNNKMVDTLRAVEKCCQHPGKMWTLDNNRISPLLPYDIDGQPWHSNQYANLPEIWVQNASLEIAKTEVVFKYGQITGKNIMPFFTNEHEGFDINNEKDFFEALRLVGTATLPKVAQKNIFERELG